MRAPGAPLLTRRARLGAALLLVAAVIAGVAGGQTAARFSSAAVNSGNSFSAADSFGSGGSGSVGSAALAKATADAEAYSAGVLADNPVAYWRFGEPDDGSTLTAVDVTGNGHNGTFHALYGPERGQSGSTGDGDTAYRWSATDSDVTVPHHSALNLNGSFTVELWTRMEAMNSSSNSRLLLDKGGNPDANGWRIEYSQNGSLQFMRNLTSISSATGVMAVGGYKHVLVTYDGTTLRWYINGSLSTSNAVAYPVSAGTGTVRFVPIGIPSGEILHVDEPALYASALTATQVRERYVAGRRFVGDPCSTYRVYANVTDHGSTGISSVTADLTTMTSGASAVPLTAGSYTVGGVSYGYRSAPQRLQVQPGSYSYSVTSVDSAGTHTQTGLTATVDTPIPVTTTWQTGLEQGVFQTPDLFSGNFNSAIDSTVARTGTYSLRENKTLNGMAYAAKNFFNANTSLTFAVRLASLPLTDVTSLAYGNALTTPLYLGYQASTQKLALRWGSNAPLLSANAIQAGSWYAIDLRIDTSVNPNTAVWQVDGVDQGTLSHNAAAQPMSEFRFGSIVAADVFTANYDDIVHSRSLLDFPLGPVKIRPLRPNGMGTHSSPAHFQHEDGSAISASTYARLDESPTNQISEGGVRQVVDSGTSFLELTVDDTSEACVRGVQALSAHHKIASQVNVMKTSVFSGTTERVVHSGDSVGTNVTSQKTVPITPATLPWSPSELNGLVFRIGYSTDTSPQPYWDALLIEYASPG